jgi:hypothetical protein
MDILMIPVEQRALHNPDKGIIGDCFSATLASILHLPIEEVPLFASCADDVWVKECNAWLSQFNLCYIPLQFDSMTATKEWVQHLGIKNLYHEAAGDSPRFPGTGHSTVGMDGVCVFDPHVEGIGLAKDTNEYWIGLIISLTPWKNIENHA